MTTESDRELLELAAKAAGIAIPKSLNSWVTYNDQSGFQWWNMDGTRTEKVFNPLTDDGDALRLAVKLGIEVIPGMAHWGRCPHTLQSAEGTERH